MTFFSRTSSTGKILAIFALLLSAVSCIYIPYPVPAHVEYIEDAAFPDDAILSVASRELLEDVAEAITDADDNIEVIDGILFRDTAFPEGDWTLHNMLMPDTCRRINEELDVDYLVLVSTEGVIESETEGFIVPFLGAASDKKQMTIDAMLLDLKAGESLCRISSEAHGTEKMFYWVIFVAAAGPVTDYSSITGLGGEVAKVIRENARSDKVRIAIMSIVAMAEE